MEYDEYEVGPSNADLPIRASSVDPSNDQGLDIEMGDLDTARDNGLPVSQRKIKKPRKIIKNGEYESYYRD